MALHLPPEGFGGVHRAALCHFAGYGGAAPVLLSVPLPHGSGVCPAAGAICALHRQSDGCILAAMLKQQCPVYWLRKPACAVELHQLRFVLALCLSRTSTGGILHLVLLHGCRCWVKGCSSFLGLLARLLLIHLN